MSFSIIIPAYNAAGTLGAALDSLLGQAFPGWEAIVVNDGSTDETLKVARQFANRDARIKVVTPRPRWLDGLSRLLRRGQGQRLAQMPPPGKQGMTLARNTGLAHAMGEWIVFLDADDWLEPGALKHFRQAAMAHPDAGVLCGRWARVAEDGTVVEDSFRLESPDLFSVVARFCPFAIHSCAVRRDVVTRLGGFDPEHHLCADWDFWQRLARLGIPVASIEARVAAYRMSPGSSIANIEEILVEGLEIIDRGHGPDTRVQDPDSRFAGGSPGKDKAGARLRFLSWQAALMIGSGGDATALLRHLVEGDRDPELKPSDVAATFHTAALVPLMLTPESWPEQWPRFAPPIESFLGALEARCGAPGLARRAMNTLEQLVIGNAARRPLTIGRRHAAVAEITEPVPDVRLSAEVERIACALTLQGEAVGEINLPVFAGEVPSYLLRDAIAGFHAWDILRAWFSVQVYPALSLTREGGITRVARGDLDLGDLAGDQPDSLPSALHDAVGWTIFLQELWGFPGWPMDRFYQAGDEDHDTPVPATGDIVLEIAAPVPAVSTENPIRVEWTLAGISMGLMTMEPVDGLVTAQRLRSAATQFLGFELARVAVREALVGQPLDNGESLRERLARLARPEPGEAATPEPAGSLVVPSGTRMAPRADRALTRALTQRPSMVLAGHRPGLPGTSVSRHARLPRESVTELEAAAIAAGEPFFRSEISPTGCVVYAPDLLWSRDEHHLSAGVAPPAVRRLADPGYDRHYFETVFLADSDPWKYTSAFERRKYEQALSLVPGTRPGRALELACAEGMFTRLLAPLVDQLVATDISAIALDRARTRCQHMENIEFLQHDFAADPFPGGYDLVVCSEALYYLRDIDALRELGRRVAEALVPGGFLLTTHSTAVVDDPGSTGLHWDVPFGAKVIGEVFAATPGLRLVTELRSPFYRVHLLQKASTTGDSTAENPAVEDVSAADLPPHLASRFLIGGGTVKHGGKPEALTYRLPILLYHQIAGDGPDSLARYRVTPEAFAEQMTYLHQAGFHTITLERWLQAMREYQPVPGRAVIITFDDGYGDFAARAWPVLEGFGFGAYVYLVTDRVGQQSTWTATYGGSAQLMDWEDITRLKSGGVAFGSHTATHPHLEALSPVEVVRELSRSKATLYQRLEGPVSSIAYPNGSEDQSIQHLAGACGYLFGLTCRDGLSSFTDSPLAFPRIEVKGGDSLEAFIARLGG